MSDTTLSCGHLKMIHGGRRGMQTVMADRVEETALQFPVWLPQHKGVLRDGIAPDVRTVRLF